MNQRENPDRSVVQPFERHWRAYDSWYDRNPAVYRSELKAVKRLLPEGTGLEIGVGTGRFAGPLDVAFGLDPALVMLRQARRRGVPTVQGLGESLPFAGETFHFVLVVVTLCFIGNPQQFIREAVRVLRKEGRLILAAIDRESRWGRVYDDPKTKERSSFFRRARFFSVQDIISLLQSSHLRIDTVIQTLRQIPGSAIDEDPIEGSGEGGFVVFSAKKP